MTNSKLIGYLRAHESDIAWGNDDFGELREIYEEVFDAVPRKDSDMLDRYSPIWQVLDVIIQSHECFTDNQYLDKRHGDKYTSIEEIKVMRNLLKPSDVSATEVHDLMEGR